MAGMAAISSETELRALHPAPKERTLRKQLDRLDRHCRRFIELAPFVVMATADAEGHMDATPRGGGPGFVKVADERTLLLPDRPGNNRLDSLSNLTEHPEIGLLFMIPGVDETLRVNGAVELRTDADLAEPFRIGRRAPAVVLRITGAGGLPALRQGAHALTPVERRGADRPVGAADARRDAARPDRLGRGGVASRDGRALPPGALLAVHSGAG
jgi:predicted pyridoxine 5'-phosphate oxidase superfamily flavin-nucleotide-binding protein